MLFKYKKEKKIEAFPGCYIEKLSLESFIENLKDRNIYILDKRGEDIRKAEIKEDPMFILGDQEGLQKREFRNLSKVAKKISLGDVTYFSSQSITILNNELDRRGV